MSPTDAVLTVILLLATAVWLGGFVAIAIVARVAARTLDPAARVDFFRALGRTYAVVGPAALVIAYAAGGVLLRGHPWDGVLVTTVAVAAALAAILAAGMVQARRMTRLRRRALDPGADPALDARVRRAAVRAGALRAAIGALTLALLVLGVASAA